MVSTRLSLPCYGKRYPQLTLSYTHDEISGPSYYDNT